MARSITRCALGRISLRKLAHRAERRDHVLWSRSRSVSNEEDILILGKVVGTIVTTISHPHYKNRRLLVVQPLVMDGDTPEPNEDFIALDNTQAGIGDTVLVNREGNGARQALNIPDGAVISVIVGIVDSIYLQD
jgi:ethanolamine utilization protein EutN